MIKRFLVAAGSVALAACASSGPLAPLAYTRASRAMSYSAQARQAMAMTFGTTSLRPGGYLWRSTIPDGGTTSVVVNLAAQRAYVYRAGELVGVSSISSGRPGKETPVGVFSILEKRQFYRSKKYHNAPMPWMERIDQYGDALHGGATPGYPESHGCVHLPDKFAAKLYTLTQIGSRVVIEG